MSTRNIQVPNDLAGRLESRADDEGVDPSGLAERALREFLDRNPVGFVGMIDSPTLCGAHVNEALAEGGFGT